MVNEDRELVEQVLSGDREAFGKLVRKYNRMAGAISYGICGDFNAADDIVQEAFLKAYRCLGALKDPGRFKLWFAGIVRTKAIDFVRQRKSFWSIPSNVSGGSHFEGEPYNSEVAEDLFMREEFRSKILEAIRGLPEEDRLVITLKHMEGLSYKEIAEITESTESAVESRLFRARAALRKKLDHLLKSV
jgi:RNA polymerase sigma-70 factor (ECF subfamily)